MRIAQQPNALQSRSLCGKNVQVKKNFSHATPAHYTRRSSTLSLKASCDKVVLRNHNNEPLGDNSALAEFPRRSCLAALPLGTLLFDGTEAKAGAKSFFDFEVLQYGVKVPLNNFQGKNANYPGLRELYEKYHDSGFELIAFPSNQFGCQAPGSSDEERAYAWKKFGFEFPVMDKIAVKNKATPFCRFSRSLGSIEYDEDGLAKDPEPDETVVQPMDPVYAFLKQRPYNKEIEWNYVKFLIGRDGQVLRRYTPAGPLEQGMEKDVRAALEEQPLPKQRFVCARGKPNSI
ncbi:hypothetical protein CYMTET_52316 [Cymbomonas tetramitiformis]|uniref:Glutathione peroxidase n=1 Tax=Cymbomonas tetramitiformis TaxID=36881 RepID=A0AAE0ERG9_9CHLO|nr:hypothetical protein CYMTET_52316 [Cymbomonas tetramitiformis]